MARRLPMLLAGLVALLTLVAADVTLAPGGTKQATAQSQRPGRLVRSEHLELEVSRNGKVYVVDLAILMLDDNTGDYPNKVKKAKDDIKVRFANATESHTESETERFTTSGFRWQGNTAAWSYNAAGKPGTLAGDTTAVLGGANGWNNAGGANWTFTGGGATTANTAGCHGSMDSRNTVGWYAQSGNVLAVTCSWYDASTTPYRAVEFDMEITPNVAWTTAGGSGFDLQSVALHEFGHAAGLNHSQTGCPGPVMCSTIASGVVNRVPHADDIAGLIAIYGSGGAPTPTPTATPTPTSTPKPKPTATPTTTPTPTPDTSAMATLTSPTPGSTLAGSSATFIWTAVGGATEYWLSVGTTGVGSANVYSGSQGTSLTSTVSALPTSGTVYVRLWTKVNGAWPSKDYTFQGGSGGVGSTATTSLRFTTLAVGASLPSDTECAARLRRSAWEPRPENATANATPGITGVPTDGASTAFNTRYAARISGSFSGTTDEIIQWGACKWGFDEDIVRAVAVQESYWRQSGVGDFANGDYQSFGLLQVKRSVHTGTHPASANSTAFNVDYALAWRRACYEGDFTWLNHAGKQGGYSAGDEWGCVGAWFSGDWKDTGALDYIAKIKAHLSAKPWLQAGF